MAWQRVYCNLIQMRKEVTECGITPFLTSNHFSMSSDHFFKPMEEEQPVRWSYVITLLKECTLAQMRGSVYICAGTSWPSAVVRPLGIAPFVTSASTTVKAFNFRRLHSHHCPNRLPLACLALESPAWLQCFLDPFMERRCRAFLLLSC